MAYHCVVLAKQVPDTKAVTGKAMNDDGTVNRAALPAVFNPEDLNALEMALQVKARYGGTVTIMTMGLPSACTVLRAGLARGADRAVLITDRRAAASDTLATSYILSCAVKKLGDVDLVLCGRQAIDGDTAQVGPQAAEKLGIGQVTYVEELSIDGRTVTAKRNVGNGWERVTAEMPLLLTVMETANEPRPARCPTPDAVQKGTRRGRTGQAGQWPGDGQGTQSQKHAHRSMGPGRPESRYGLVRPQRFAHQGAPHPERGAHGQ